MVEDGGGNRGSVPGELLGVCVWYSVTTLSCTVMTAVINFCDLGGVAAGRGHGEYEGGDGGRVSRLGKDDARRILFFCF